MNEIYKARRVHIENNLFLTLVERLIRILNFREFYPKKDIKFMIINF